MLDYHISYFMSNELLLIYCNILAYKVQGGSYDPP